LKVKEINGMRFLKFSTLSRRGGVKHLITTTDSGCAKEGMLTEDDRLMSVLKEHFGHATVYFIRAQHGDKVLVVPPSLNETSQQFECDGLIYVMSLFRGKERRNWQPAILACTTGDCPHLFITADYLASNHLPVRLVALVHSGWRGCAKNIVARAMEQIRELGCPLPKLRIGLWGGICTPCYIVDVAVWKELLPYHRYFTPAGDPHHWHLNLRGVIKNQLAQFGIKPTQIETSMFCSKCHRQADGKHFLFSHRRNELARNGVFISG